MLPSRIELNRRKDAEGVRDGWKKLLFCSPVSRTLSDVSYTKCQRAFAALFLFCWTKSIQGFERSKVCSVT